MLGSEFLNTQYLTRKKIFPLKKLTLHPTLIHSRCIITPREALDRLFFRREPFGASLRFRGFHQVVIRSISLCYRFSDAQCLIDVSNFHAARGKDYDEIQLGNSGNGVVEEQFKRRNRVVVVAIQLEMETPNFTTECRKFYFSAFGVTVIIKLCILPDYCRYCTMFDDRTQKKSIWVTVAPKYTRFYEESQRILFFCILS